VQVGLEADGLAVGGDRLGQLPLGRQGVAQVVVCLGEVGLEAEGLLAGGDRLIQLPLVPQDDAQVGVC
jgi:hypothetical protein